MSMFDLTGKVALVTGASYGIGFAIASGFAAAGAKIVFNDIKQELVDKGLAAYAEAGIDAKDISWIKGTCYKAREIDMDEDTVMLPSYEEIVASKEAYAKSFALAYRSNDYINGKRLVEKYNPVWGQLPGLGMV